MLLKTATLLLLALFLSPPAGAGSAAEVEEVWFDNLLAEPGGFYLQALSTGSPGASARVTWSGGRGKAPPSGALARLPVATSTTRVPIWRKLEVVTDVRPAGAAPYSFALGVDGVAFPRETGLVFLPGEVLARGLMDEEGRWHPERARAYLAEKGRSFPAGSRPAWIFSTDGVLLTRGERVPLFREHRRFAAPDPDLLLESARAGGRYLVRSTCPDGRFLYSYLPDRDRPAAGYNIVRHAGTIYAMLELQEVAPDPDLLAAVERAIGYLLRQMERTTEDRAVVVEDGRVKLGGVALAAVALAKHAEVTGSRRHLPDLLALGRFIASVQSEEGEFWPHVIFWPSGKTKYFTSGYYPGEALLACLRIHAFDPEGPWLDLVERGARWLIEVRDADLTVDDIAHDHWLLYALRELLVHRPRAVYRVHAMKLADAICFAQNLDSIWPDWAGTWYEPPRSTPSATRSEGLVCAFDVARTSGDVIRTEGIEIALRAAVRFQLTTQFRPENAMHLKNPWRALGGFRQSLTVSEIRIDYVQHNISALLGFRRILAD